MSVNQEIGETNVTDVGKQVMSKKIVLNQELPLVIEKKESNLYIILFIFRKFHIIIILIYLLRLTII